MGKLTHLEPGAVLGYFEEICAIPHGSGDMERISAYCMEFAKAHSLEAYRDDANNVIIKKGASAGYEKSAPVILQGHLDMVCQRTEECEIDFAADGLDIYVDGDYITANGTTLGADNGIAVAMILAILADNSLSHPPIEAVFTTDEEIGMPGAIALDFDRLSGRRMINMDSEDESVVTVSCAGGSDLTARLAADRVKKSGSCVKVAVKGLKGGHSGVEIDKGRVNANVLMGRILGHIKESVDFDIISIDGGDKMNAIPLSCVATLCCGDSDALIGQVNAYADIIANEIKSREADFCCESQVLGTGEYDVLANDSTNKLIHALMLAPNGVIEMSAEIDGLVQTSLNLGVLKTDADTVSFSFALRSNKKSALIYLEERLCAFFKNIGCEIATGGHYPPWEFKNDSQLQRLYVQKYREKKGTEPKVEAIHAGLECGVFADALSGLDCISIGPEMHDIHTTGERLGIRSTKEIYEIVIDVLSALK